jgi:hypothetical protein
MTTRVTLESLLETVEKIAPTLRKHAAEAEERRRLSDAAAAAMKDAGSTACGSRAHTAGSRWTR